MNSKKKTLILSILILLIAIVTGVSITYALWQSKHVTNPNIVSSTCLRIDYDELSGPITLTRTSPGSFTIYDEDNNNHNDYYFKVTNTCESNVEYNINLETLEETDINKEYLMVLFYGFEDTDNAINNYEDILNILESNNSQNIKPIANIETTLDKFENTNTTLDNALYSNKLVSVKINPHETHAYSLSMGLNFALNNNENVINKTWKGKIIVNSNPINATNIKFNSGDEQIDQSDKIIEVGQEYGELPTPHKDGYVFDYWYYGNDENNKVLESDIVKTNNNQILNAKWLEGTLLKTDAFFKFPYYKTFIHNIEFYKGNFTSLGLVTHSFTPNPRYNVIQTQWITDGNAIELQEKGYTPVYAWYEDHTLYYYTDAPYIYFNEHDGFGTRNGDINNTYRLEDSVDLSRFRTSKMTDMSYMFYGNINLTSLDLSNFDTNNVTNMKGMFERLENLQFLNISNFNTLNVTDMSEMFMNCKSLTLLDLSGFNVDRLQDASQMFRGSKKLLDINLSSFIGHTFEDKNMICLSGCDYGEYIYPEDLHGYEPSENAGCDTAFCTQ